MPPPTSPCSPRPPPWAAAVLFGVIVVWTFGQGTVKDLLPLPTPRATIVGAKFAVTAGWCLLGYALVAALAAAGVLGTDSWWKHADQDR